MWKPIETAPKDATRILVCKADDADGKPMGESFGLFVQRAAWWEGEGWVVYCSLVRDPTCFFEPTHWMEIPPPPPLPVMANAAATKKSECEGACELHTGDIREVEVQGWGTFKYCEAAVNEDQRRGLFVTDYLPDNAELCGGTSATNAVLNGKTN